MRKDLILLYGLLAYLGFILTVAYGVAFFGNLFVSRTIDAAAVVTFGEAVVVNLGLLLLFGLQHSGMARKSFKRWLTARLHPCLERSTYVLTSSIALAGLMVFWQPMGGVVWSITGTAISIFIYLLYFIGWGLMAYATFLINHFELFGLSQVWRAYLGIEHPVAEFRTPGLYRHVRHPIYLGWLLILWATPIMTVTHLLLAAGLTLYILIGIQFEERDLGTDLACYEQYKRKVPMLLPSPGRHLLRDDVAKTPQPLGGRGRSRLRFGRPLD